MPTPPRTDDSKKDESGDPTSGHTAIGYVIILLIIIAGPLALLWSINTLFNTSIPITLETGVATDILLAIIWGYTRLIRIGR